MRRIRMLLTALLCTAGLVAGGLSVAAPAAANPNPIDWRVADMFTFSFGIPMPLRYGQHDNGDEDGFGKYHIEDGHVIVPPHEDIQETINLPAPACVTKADGRHVCANEDLALVVVFTENIDSRSGDGIAFGIITAYYYIPCLSGLRCPPPVPGPTPSALTYTGPDEVTNGAATRLSARLTDNFGIALPNRPVTFALGSGAAAQTCTGTSGADGTAACTITVHQPAAAAVSLTVSYPGNPDTTGSTVSVTLGMHTPTTLTWTGPRTVANGEAAPLSAVLRDPSGAGVPGRTVELAIGSGGARQACTTATGADGTARCTIADVRQPLNDAATVPFGGTFAGDEVYLPSSATATLALRYLTGRAYGTSADVRLPLLPISVPPQPDTGRVRTADATTVTPPCSSTVTLPGLDARLLCADWTSDLDPATGTATATLKQATIGLPGLPVIGVSGVRATATARCGAATGSTAVTLTVGGLPVTVPNEPNVTIPLLGGGTLIVNEQRPVAGADAGVSVTAVRLVLAGNLGEMVIGSATSAVHNCG